MTDAPEPTEAEIVTVAGPADLSAAEAGFAREAEWFKAKYGPPVAVVPSVDCTREGD